MAQVLQFLSISWHINIELPVPGFFCQTANAKLLVLAYKIICGTDMTQIFSAIISNPIVC